MKWPYYAQTSEFTATDCLVSTTLKSSLSNSFYLGMNSSYRQAPPEIQVDEQVHHLLLAAYEPSQLAERLRAPESIITPLYGEGS